MKFQIMLVPYQEGTTVSRMAESHLLATQAEDGTWVINRDRWSQTIGVRQSDDFLGVMVRIARHVGIDLAEPSDGPPKE